MVSFVPFRGIIDRAGPQAAYRAALIVFFSHIEGS